MENIIENTIDENKLSRVIEESGLNHSKAEQIYNIFNPMVNMLKEFELAYNDIIR